MATTSAQFLKIEVGPRAAAMGNAFVAVADDATALYWNPAGITKIGYNSVSFNHKEWFAGISHDYGAAVINLPGIGSIGASLTSLSMGEMDVRTEMQPDGTGESFAAGDLAVSGSFARDLTDRFSIGFTGKFIRQQIWHMSANSMALDIGTLYKTQFHGMKIGMSISNFGPNMQLTGRDASFQYDPDQEATGNNDNINAFMETEKWPIPLIFRVGLAMDVINNPFLKVTTALDAVHPNDVDEYVNFGTEIVWNNFLALRGGIRHWGNSIFAGDSPVGNSGSLTFGAGINYDINRNLKVTVDYAYLDYGLLEKTQRVAISLSFR
ncbi:MAG: PorV/PorQ family protein [Candidatus Marinimicrobia bacterium]|nr:PorV/PorQ family protein [Candidatus Neomarinimicrobiota bacterium]